MITVAIPTKNKAHSLSFVIRCLLMQAHEPFKVIIADNESSDGTIEMLNVQIANKYWGDLDIAVKQAGSIEGGKTKNVPFMRRFLMEHIYTPFVFWLDSDVLLPPNALAPLREEFEKRKDHLGMLGIRYEPKIDHVQMGATMMDVNIARKIEWKIDHQCECKNAHLQMGPMRLGSDYHDVLQARHLKVI